MAGSDLVDAQAAVPVPGGALKWGESLRFLMRRSRLALRATLPWIRGLAGSALALRGPAPYLPFSMATVWQVHDIQRSGTMAITRDGSPP